MADKTALTTAEWLAALRRLQICDAEASGLSYPGNKALIIALSTEREQLTNLLQLPPPEERPRLDGWYSCETLSGCFGSGEIDFRTFAVTALDFLAAEVDMISTCSVKNARMFTSRFGPELTETLLDILTQGLGNFRTEYRRIEQVIEDEETGEERIKYASIYDPDPGFEECGYLPCQAGDEGATLITVMEFDFDSWEGLEHQVQERERAANEVRRMPITVEANHG
ncbi:MAG: hypothetical protein ACRDBL_04645 [Rhabdaerophilum sp.]